MKKIILILVSILLVFAIYVTIDCIKLRNAEFNTKPIIVLREDSIDKTEQIKIVKYMGIGYTISYLFNYDSKGNEKIVSSGYGAEFRLFDKILIWAWVE